MKRIASFLTALSLCAACAGKKPQTAEEYHAAATAQMQDGAYPLAVESYRELLDQHPFSDHTEEAELKIAHALYQTGACPEAIAAFSDFQRRHPTSPYLAFVGYLIGECHEQQMQQPDRDQSAAQSANAYYKAVIQQYPGSPFADLAGQQLAHCRENLAEHEYGVAIFYGKRGNRRAEEARLIDLVRRFNDTDRAADALLRLGDLYSDEDEMEKALLSYAAVIYHHPDNNAAAEAAERVAELTTDGNEPVGDPLAALTALSGRSREIEVVNRESGPEAEGDSGARVGFNQPRPEDAIQTGRPNKRY
jgi:outer membrane protein assembly factor BamD